MSAAEDRAPEQDASEGTVWVCGACGKEASNRYFGGISRGWDASCMTWAVLVDVTTIERNAEGRIVKCSAVKT